MKVVGLTGGIASGKSTVSQYFKSKGISLIDCDELARIVVEPGHPAYINVIKAFGVGILNSDRTLNRAKLGQIIFNDPSKRKALNAITHPWIRWEISKRIFKYWITGKKMVVVDAPLLIESGLRKFMSEVIVVYCPLEVQLHRLIARDNLSSQDAISRINSQMQMSDKLKYATKILDNSQSIEALQKQIEQTVDSMMPSTIATWFWLYTPPVGLIGVSFLAKRFIQMLLS